MYGANIGSLSLVLRTKTSDSVIWKRREGLGDIWYPAEVDIISSDSFQVQFSKKSSK